MEAVHEAKPILVVEDEAIMRESVRDWLADVGSFPLLTLYFYSSLPDIMADFDQLQQVCTNLIINAVQAMPEGGKLTLHTSTSDSLLKIEVKDTGCGISQENLPKLFTPFFTTKGKGRGVGLSLAVAHGIIQRHQGRIEVQSKEGEGTNFTIYLPIHHEEREAD